MLRETEDFLRGKYCTDNDFLTSYSPKDKSWDIHKAQADAVANLYSQTVYDRYCGKLNECSGYLAFHFIDNPQTGESKLKLFRASFCRLRHCPICQWRRSLLWMIRFKNTLPEIQSKHPTARYIFLTLTVKNCDLNELRETLQAMNKGWKRLIQRPDWPALGFIRTTEVTRSDIGEAHPHFHCIMLVKPGYFSKYYIKHSEWIEMWQKVMRLNYSPNLDIRVIATKNIEKSICELIKYAIKPDDLMYSAQWLEGITKQLSRLRFIATGGVLKNCLREGDETNEDLIKLESNSNTEQAPELRFGWNRPAQRYKKITRK